MGDIDWKSGREYFKFSRREFLKAISAIAASFGVQSSAKGLAAKRLQPRRGKPNPFVEDGKPLLVAVEGQDAEKMLAKGLEAIGGLGKAVASGDRTFIKPNYGSHRAYPTGSDPNFLILIAQHLKKDGAGKVIICDSSDAYVLNKYNDFEYVFKTNNVFEIGKKTGVEVICTHPMDEKEYVSVYSDRWQKNPEIKVNRHLLGASVLINQPMLKKHNEASMTCALKNFYGAVYQPQRMNSHNKLKDGGEQGKDFFMKTVAEFADAMRPELNIVDARKILTVRGPSLKEGSVVKDINKIIICGDIVATDAYCAQILDANDETFDKEMIAPTLQYAEKLGLGTADLNKVKIIEITV
jgi:uncharacterized protein (DUF362 family)